MKSMIQKFLPVFAVSLVLVTACSKDDGNEPQPSPPAVNTIGTPPGNYTHKVLLEYHTAAWCGTCVDAETKRNLVMTNYPGKVIPVAIHQSDNMQIPLFFTIDATFGSNTAYGMVNRVPSLGTVLLNRTQWMTNTSSQLSATAKCGLAINSIANGNTATIEVQAAFREQVIGDHTLTVYILENDVTGSGSGWDQANSYNNDSSSPYYQQGNPITGYKHKYVVRKVATGDLGDLIDPSKQVVGGLIKKTYNVSLAGMNPDRVSIVAFVCKKGTSDTTYEVLNVQSAGLGKLKNWD